MIRLSAPEPDPVAEEEEFAATPRFEDESDRSAGAGR
jgi:hypothetical protein